ncbi:hypothetical protein L0B53_15080 [Vibrio sp. SS-MA-C1-2]|uniref:hypothetical protein n=1 Tax=Vibrio sp. SS-MA-C1-2 TaxID=2908646 RepID=UPI001F3252C3|nr:hypothetical protein [Vibrio sp. SS-MA-C1-2]UJF18331.1 hypothetical protein L0B53_15080 [Vibrio sp. SS-MA-C1-2]
MITNSEQKNRLSTIQSQLIDHSVINRVQVETLVDENRIVAELEMKGILLDQLPQQAIKASFKVNNNQYGVVFFERSNVVLTYRIAESSTNDNIEMESIDISSSRQFLRWLDSQPNLNKYNICTHQLAI